MMLENNWPEVQRLAKKYHRHREIGEGLSHALEALVSLVLCKDRYLERVPFEYSVEHEDWREHVSLPEEVLEETRSTLKSSSKHSLKAYRAGTMDSDDQVVLIANAFVSLFSNKDKKSNKSNKETDEAVAQGVVFDGVILGTLSAKYRHMQELFDLFYWLNVYVTSFQDASKFDLILQAHADLSSREAQLTQSALFQEIYREALFRHSLFLVESGRFVQGANGLRRFLVETRQTGERNPARLVAMRCLLRLLEEHFGDSSYRTSILEFPLSDTPYQPTCRSEEIALLGLLYAKEFIRSRAELTKERVQFCWGHLKQVVASRLCRVNANESLEVLYGMVFGSGTVDFTFYEEMLGIYCGLNRVWEAYYVAINIASRSVNAQRFLLHFPSQHCKLKKVSQDAHVLDSIEDYSKLEGEAELKKPVFEAVRLYKVGKVEEGIVLLKKLFTQKPEDIRIRRLLFFMLAQSGSEEIWELFEAEEERDHLILAVAIEFAYEWGFKGRLSQIASHLRGIVEMETAPLSLSLSHSISDPLAMKGALTDGDAISLGGSTSLGAYSVGYQSETNLPLNPGGGINKHPTAEEWYSRSSLISAEEFRCRKLFNYPSHLSCGEWPPVKPKEILDVSSNACNMGSSEFEVLFAQALARLAQYDEAIGVLQQAAKRDELDPAVPSMLALVYEMRGDVEQMRECIEKTKVLRLLEDVPASAQVLLFRGVEEKIIKGLIE